MAAAVVAEVTCRVAAVAMSARRTSAAEAAGSQADSTTHRALPPAQAASKNTLRMSATGVFDLAEIITE